MDYKKLRIFLPWIGLLFTIAATFTVLIGHAVDALVWSALLIVTLDSALLRGEKKRIISRNLFREEQNGYTPYTITIGGEEWTELGNKGLLHPWMINHIQIPKSHNRYGDRILEMVRPGIDRITPLVAQAFLHARGYRGATPQELAAFVLKYPEAGVDGKVLAVGEFVVPTNSFETDLYVLVYGRLLFPNGLYVFGERAISTYSAEIKLLAVPLDN